MEMSHNMTFRSGQSILLRHEHVACVHAQKMDNRELSEAGGQVSPHVNVAGRKQAQVQGQHQARQHTLAELQEFVAMLYTSTRYTVRVTSILSLLLTFTSSDTSPPNT